MQLTITIPDDAAQRAEDAFAAKYGYDVSSGLTKGQFAKKQVAAYVKNVLNEYETEQAEADAAAAKAAEIDAINIQ